MLGGVALRGTPDASLMRATIGALPRDVRREMRRDSREALRVTGDGVALRQARADLLDALRTDPFDAATFRASLDAGQARLLRVSERVQDRLVARLSTMDLPARQAIADRLETRTMRPAAPTP
jgi:uncharacterized membrane protein